MSGRGPVIAITLTADDKTKSGFKSATVNAEGFGDKIGKTGIAVGAFVGTLAAQAGPKLIGFGKELFGVGQAAETMGKKADTVFGSSAASIKKWADDNNEALGISDERLTGLAASMGDLLVPMGFSREAAAGLTTDTLNAAGALAAWSGGQYDAAQVSDIMTKAMLGERDGLKALGISINQAEVDERALAIAKRDGRDEITEMDKALATQALMLEKSQDAQTAWADGTMDGVKATAEMSAMIDDAKVAIGRRLVPVVQGFARFLTQRLIPGIRQTAGFIRDNWIPITAGLTAAFVLLVPTLIGAAAAGWAAVAPMLVAAAPFIAVAAAIAGLTAGVIWLYDNWKPFHTAVDATVGFFKAEVIPTLTTVATFIRDKVVPPVWKIATIWVKVHIEVAKMIGKIVGLVVGIPGKIVGALSGAATLLVSKGQDIMRGLRNGVTWYWDNVLKRVYIDIPKKVLTAIGGLTMTLVGKGKDLLTGFKSGFVTYWSDTAWPWLRGIPASILKAIGGLGSLLYNAGRDLIGGLINGITSKAGSIGSSIRNAIPGGSAVSSVASKVFPFAQGGIVKKRPGGILAQIGEGRYDEAVIPLRPGLAVSGGGGVTNVYQNFPAGTRPDDVARANQRYAHRNGIAAA